MTRQDDMFGADDPEAARLLRDLLAEDEATRVPAHVGVAVLCAWDAIPAGPRPRFATARTRVGWRSVAMFGATAAAAGVLNLLTDGRGTRYRSDEAKTHAPREVQAALRRPAEPSAPAGAPHIASLAPAPVAAVIGGRVRLGRTTSPATSRRQSGTGQIPADTAPETAALDASVAAPRPYRLIDEASDPPGSMSLVRVRMSRGALSILGVPVLEPESAGLVDVDVLVGEDGVARAIYRATLVTSGG